MKVDRSHVAAALDRTRRHLLDTQAADGTWTGRIESDVRSTAFYLNTLWCLGRKPDGRTGAMERYLRATQLGCGGWERWPGGGPDVDVTAVCMLALDRAATPAGRSAAAAARGWLTARRAPQGDMFWKSYLALRGELDWDEVPYVSPRLVSNPRWVHPNIHDFSFARAAIVALALIQAHVQRQPADSRTSSRTPQEREDPELAAWKQRWVAGVRVPLSGVLPVLAELTRRVDRILPLERHRRAALDWLLAHQEADGSWFSAVHMTSMAVLALHTLDPERYAARIEAGLEAMRRWQVVDGRGRWQQFTDSTTWDTAQCTDLLRRCGVPARGAAITRARDSLVAGQNSHLGDWSQRARGVAPGGWCFQRTGKWYPDCDDAALVTGVLLDLDDAVAIDAVRRGVGWLIGMQGRSGGWASWDRHDRGCIVFGSAGPWFARDLECADITGRAVSLLSRVLTRRHAALADLLPAVRRSRDRGVRWLMAHREGDAWFGAWFTHYLYGTARAVEALGDAGVAAGDPVMRSALGWMLARANPDGGFGERPESAVEGRFVGGASTPFHTGIALAAIVRIAGPGHPAATRAAAWLCNHQDEDGVWANRDFCAAGVPGLWYASFSLTATYSAANGLLAYRDALGPGHRWSRVRCR